MGWTSARRDRRPLSPEPGGSRDRIEGGGWGGAKVLIAGADRWVGGLAEGHRAVLDLQGQVAGGSVEGEEVLPQQPRLVQVHDRLVPPPRELHRNPGGGCSRAPESRGEMSPR